MNNVTKRIAMIFLAMTLAVCFSVPAMAAENTDQNTLSFGDLFSGKTAKTIKTNIKGSGKTVKVLKYGAAKPIEKITVNHGFGRTVFLEKYVAGKWAVVRTYKAANGDRKKKISLDFSTDGVKKRRSNGGSGSLKQQLQLIKRSAAQRFVTMSYTKKL
jgi:hypothetical protein